MFPHIFGPPFAACKALQMPVQLGSPWPQERGQTCRAAAAVPLHRKPHQPLLRYKIAQENKLKKKKEKTHRVSTVPDIKHLDDAAGAGMGLTTAFPPRHPQHTGWTGSSATLLWHIPHPHQRHISGSGESSLGWAQHPTSGSAPVHSIPCQMWGETPTRCFPRKQKHLSQQSRRSVRSMSPAHPRHPESAPTTQPYSPSLQQRPHRLHGHLFKLNLHLKISKQTGKSVVWAEINLLKLSEE